MGQLKFEVGKTYIASGIGIDADKCTKIKIVEMTETTVLYQNLDSASGSPKSVRMRKKEFQNEFYPLEVVSEMQLFVVQDGRERHLILAYNQNDAIEIFCETSNKEKGYIKYLVVSAYNNHLKDKDGKVIDLGVIIEVYHTPQYIYKMQ